MYDYKLHETWLASECSTDTADEQVNLGLRCSLMILIPLLTVSQQCSRPLGMKDGAISDFQLTASSSRTGNPPTEARPHGVGFCAQSDDPKPYLQVYSQRNFFKIVYPMWLTVLLKNWKECKKYERCPGRATSTEDSLLVIPEGRPNKPWQTLDRQQAMTQVTNHRKAK